MGAIFSEEHGPLVDCSNWLALQGKPYPRTCRRCGLGMCKSVVNTAMESPQQESPPAVPLEAPYTMRSEPFTPAEIERAKAHPEASRLLFDTAPADWTIGRLRHEVRLLIDPPTIADKLAAMRDARFGVLGPVDSNIVQEAVDALQAAALVADMRPISDLHQEAYKRFGRDGSMSSPNRWVMLWGDCGYIGRTMEGRVGRLQPDGEKFAGSFVGRDYERVSDGGLTPTHFTEVPLGAIFPTV